MGKSLRYIVYLLIGMGLYYLLDADKNPEVLGAFHQYAPAAILVIVILLFAVKRVRSKREEKGE